MRSGIFQKTTMLLKTLEKIEKFSILEAEIIEIINKHGNEHNQIICQTLEEGSTDWLTGIGRIEELSEKEESLYTHINPGLQGTLLEEYILKYNAFRTRILTIQPRHCYSVHPDPTPRIHIPIKTDMQSWMVWPYHNVVKNLERKFVYWTDTRQPHTFFNGGTEPRIHIVMCVK